MACATISPNIWHRKQQWTMFKCIKNACTTWRQDSRDKVSLASFVIDIRTGVWGLPSTRCWDLGIYGVNYSPKPCLQKQSFLSRMIENDLTSLTPPLYMEITLYGRYGTVQNSTVHRNFICIFLAWYLMFSIFYNCSTQYICAYMTQRIYAPDTCDPCRDRIYGRF